MKRAPELHGLSQDHHHGLVLARKARRAAEGASAEKDASVAGAWEAVVARFSDELEPHFRVEEEELVPPLRARGEDALVARLAEDHAALRCMVAVGAPRTAEALAGFADRLEAHIRFEERELFPVAERRLTAEELRAVAEASQETRG